jgi:hypothetical protein
MNFHITMTLDKLFCVRKTSLSFDLCACFKRFLRSLASGESLLELWPPKKKLEPSGQPSPIKKIYNIIHVSTFGKLIKCSNCMFECLIIKFYITL